MNKIEDYMNNQVPNQGDEPISDEDYKTLLALLK
jgi:hypothetical protein